MKNLFLKIRNPNKPFQIPIVPLENVPAALLEVLGMPAELGARLEMEIVELEKDKFEKLREFKEL